MGQISAERKITHSREGVSEKQKTGVVEELKKNSHL
jgi:hypothetical protein